MAVRYYVLSKGPEFEVFREDVFKASAQLRSRAIDMGRAMARLESRLTGVATELQVESVDGRLHTEAAFDQVTAALPAVAPEPQGRAVAGRGR